MEEKQFWQIRLLDIRTILGDVGFIALASCVWNIEILEVGSPEDTKLTMRGIYALAEAINTRIEPVSMFLILIVESFSYFSKLNTLTLVSTFYTASSVESFSLISKLNILNW